MCTDLYADMHAGMRVVDMRAYVYVDSCVDVCVDMCVDMCVDSCVAVCVDMCADAHEHADNWIGVW